jgi:hypothetical protein
MDRPSIATSFGAPEKRLGDQVAASGSGPCTMEDGVAVPKLRVGEWRL